MAEVFLATIADDPIVRLVALKRILPQFSDDEAFVRMFLDEVRIAGRLSHPNVAMMHECGQVEGVYYLTMDFVAGVNLRALGKRGNPVPSEIITTVGAGIAAALEHAHSLADDQGTPLALVHRDVTPHNVMISFDGEVKLLDFGIAKARTQAEKTRSGVLKGKYAYMSPEQIRGAQIDHRSDIFSLGSVLYEALTAVRPFSANSPLEILKLVTEAEFPSPRSIRPDLAPELDRIVMGALERDRERRYQTAGQLEEDLRQYLADHSRVYLPQELAAYTQELFPERHKAVTDVAGEVQRGKGRGGMISQMIHLQPAPPPAEAMAPPAPFEDLAGDVDVEAQTTVWQKDGKEQKTDKTNKNKHASGSFSRSKVVRRERRSPLLVILAVLFGLFFGVGLGLGLWMLLAEPPPQEPTGPVVRPLIE